MTTVHAQPHPAPVEARLLRGRSESDAAARSPRGGVALPSSLPTPSPQAARSLSEAVAAHPGIRQLKTLPRRVVDQRDTECCVSCALAAAMEARQPAWPALSPLFHYHVTRFRNGGADAYGRLFLDRALGTLTAQGICREADHRSAFTPEGIVATPSDAAWRDAVARRIPRNGFFHRYRQIGGTSRAADIRDCLRAECPVVVAFTLPQEYPGTFLDHRNQWDTSRTRPSASRHCVLIVGFDDLRRAVQVFDSQGETRFDRGRWWMTYATLDGPLVHQAYALT